MKDEIELIKKFEDDCVLDTYIYLIHKLVTSEIMNFETRKPLSKATLPFTVV